MWIDKITRNLYLYALTTIILSGVISFGVGYASSEILDSIQIRKYEEKEAQEKLEFDNLILSLKEDIKNNNYKIEEFIDKNLIRKDKSYELYIITGNGESISLGNDDEEFEESIFERTYIYPVSFVDGDGFILIKPLGNETVSNIYEVISVLIAITVFIFLTLITLKKELKYIKEIESEVYKLAKGNLDNKIKIKGQNELARLASSINDMSSSLNEKIQREKEEDKRQKKLITNLSHDLRTPLTSIIGYLKILEDEKYKDSDEAKEYLNKAITKSNHLQKLLNDLFSYAKITNGDIKYNKTKVDLNIFLLQYLETEELDVLLNLNKNHANVEIDVDWLVRILDNLFDNIRKHGNLDKDITVNIKESNENIILEVKNYTKEDLTRKVEHLFDRTYIASESRTNSSSGLGLSIVEESMKKMNGRAEATFKDEIITIRLIFLT